MNNHSLRYSETGSGVLFLPIRASFWRVSCGLFLSPLVALFDFVLIIYIIRSNFLVVNTIIGSIHLFIFLVDYVKNS